MLCLTNKCIRSIRVKKKKKFPLIRHWSFLFLDRVLYVYHAPTKLNLGQRIWLVIEIFVWNRAGQCICATAACPCRQDLQGYIRCWKHAWKMWFLSLSLKHIHTHTLSWSHQPFSSVAGKELNTAEGEDPRPAVICISGGKRCPLLSLPRRDSAP